jgi:Flp pilus assembly protein TadD
MHWTGRAVIVLSASGVTAILTGMLSRPPQEVCAAELQPSWNHDIAPIAYANCTSCHHTGGGAPFDLTTYAQAKRWSKQMAVVTASRYMPPWLPAAGHGDFEGNRRLPQDDIQRIAAWVKQGASEGDGPPPTPPVYSREWSMGEPDLVLTMPQPIPVSASGQDVFINFVLPSGLHRTRWVRAMEIKPGPTALTHHANVIVDRTQSMRRAHPATWQQGVPGMDLFVDSGNSFDPDSHFLFWKPDSTALVEPEGMPWRLDADSDLILNMHLKPTGRPEEVQARIGLYFTDKPATELPMLLQLENDAALDIPAGNANFIVSDELKLPVSVDVLGIYPHAHYLGKRMEAWATLPNGARRDLILIEDWDIDRQSVYRYANPVPLPKGTALHMRYAYDNSSANLRNPNSPPVRVHAGNNASDEMAHLWLQVLPLPERDAADGRTRDADPRLLLEQAWMGHRLKKNAHDTIALYNFATATLAKGDAAGAIHSLRELIALTPHEVRAHTALGSALESQGDAHSAAAEFHNALTIDPGDSDARYDLASLEARQGNNAAAEKDLRILLATRPDDAGAQHLMAMTLAAEDDGMQALEHLRAWVRLAPADAEPHRALAQVLGAMGDHEAALAEQHRVVELEPKNSGDWNDLGVMEARAGQKEQARRDLEHALQLDPKNEQAKNNLSKL